MRAGIGSRHIAMSEFGVYLDQATCLRLNERAQGKPVPRTEISEKGPRIPVSPGEDASPVRVRQYERLMEEYERRAERSDAVVQKLKRQIEEFTNLEFVWAKACFDRFESLDEERVMALLHLNGEPVLADIVTGSLYSEKTNECLSSSQLHLGVIIRTASKKECVQWMKTRMEKEILCKGVEA